MVNRAIGYAYPWDFVDDPAAAPRARALGLDAVAVAANYHAVRAGTPLHPEHCTVEAPRAACYVPVREHTWQQQRLKPARATWSRVRDPFGRARDAIHAEGLEVHAWTVLTHNTYLGSANPDLTVRNAFGERYPYALCPSSDDVIDYCETLVAEIATLGQADGLILEAFGPLGFVHEGHHDKTNLAGWSELQQRLLSVCLCSGCESRYRAAGLAPAEVANAIRRAVREGTSAGSTAEVVGAETAAVLAEVRADVVRRMRTRLLFRARELAPGLRVALHASADPLASGPFSTVAGGIGGPVDALVGTCWQPGPEGADNLRALAAVAEQDTAIGGYLLADGTWGSGAEPGGIDTASRVGQYVAAGMDELHLYHLGLTGRQGLRLMADILAAARSAT